MCRTVLLYLILLSKIFIGKFGESNTAEIHLCRSFDHFRTGISVLSSDLNPIIEVCSAQSSSTKPFWTDLRTGLTISWSLSDFLATRGLSVFETWGSKNIPGRIDFYIGSVSLEQIPTKVKKSGMSIIILSNVNDTVYPPQKKSFYMFRIIHEQTRKLSRSKVNRCHSQVIWM